MSNDEILTAALKLPADKRERIVEAINHSLKSPSQRHIEAMWAQEAESRVDGFLARKVKSVPGARVLSYRGKR